MLDFIGLETVSEPVVEEGFPAFTGYPTESLDGHIYYTNEEWTSRPFYVNIIEFLKGKQIKSFLDVGGCTGEVPKIMFEKIPSLESSLILEPVSINFDLFKKDLKTNIVSKLSIRHSITDRISFLWDNLMEMWVDTICTPIVILFSLMIFLPQL